MRKVLRAAPRQRRIGTARALCLVFAMAGLAPATPLHAADAPQGRTWAEIAALPDWGGVWEPDWSILYNPNRPKPPLTPAAEKALQAFNAAKEKGENLQGEGANCVPPGMPTIMSMPYPIEFLMTPGKVTVAIETYSQMRRIFTDGRPLPADPDPAFQGYSVGKWQDGVLTVETIGFDPGTKIAEGIGHGPDMRIGERMKLVEPDVLEVETTITDPVTYTRPHVSVLRYKRHRDWDIREYVCQQNNRDAADAQGRPSMNIEM